jgi:hypothetical protein
VYYLNSECIGTGVNVSVGVGKSEDRKLGWRLAAIGVEYVRARVVCGPYLGYFLLPSLALVAPCYVCSLAYRAFLGYGVVGLVRQSRKVQSSAQ